MADLKQLRALEPKFLPVLLKHLERETQSSNTAKMTGCLSIQFQMESEGILLSPKQRNPT